MEVNDPLSCPYNANINCDVKEKPCRTCGWNPKVEEIRKERIRWYWVNPSLKPYGTFSPGGIRPFKIKKGASL